MGHKVRGRQAKKERKSKHAHHKHSSSEEKHKDHELESVHENKPEEEHNNNGIILSKVEQVDLSLLNDEGPFFEIDLKEEQMPFFGLLNSEQAAYFRQAESTLNLDTFETPDIKLTFIQSIFDEAKGNSLKLATNQICSKLMERIIMLKSNSLLRSKKSKIARKMVELEDTEDYKRSFQIPSSFEQALSLIVEIMVRTETKESLRETAIDPIASPVVQLIIELEGKANRNRPFWTLTFERADEPTNEKEKSFVEYLLSDPVGSHFLQTAISNQKMRNINRLYHLYMEDRVVKLAKRETTGSFVIQTLLEKLRAKDQTKIMDQLVPVFE
ncbi:Nop9-like rRNA processing protein [Brettanomyces bruxellensis AWRI1499]|nr:Nop9-like rRNA processing protein [Brettanomyces bruxellensis AWRI1499]